MSLPPSLLAAIQHVRFWFLIFEAFKKPMPFGLPVKKFVLSVPQKEGFSGSFQPCKVEHSFLSLMLAGFVGFFFFLFSWVCFGHEVI